MYFDFLKYYLKATNAHGIHSPFVFDLYRKVYKQFDQNADFVEIESLRKELKNDSRSLEITDLGAGSKINNNSVRKVSDIASKSLKSPFWAQFFYRIIQYYKYENILELGTSLGLTTSYLAKANPNAKIITMEGCANTSSIAQENFSKLHIDNVKIKVGNIDSTLKNVLDSFDKLDFVLFDANHQYEPTISYFNQAFEKAHEDSVFVFDDIYWSSEMKNAWNEIKSDPRVSLSLDFFYVGLIFFKKGIEKQHFTLK